MSSTLFPATLSLLACVLLSCGAMSLAQADENGDGAAVEEIQQSLVGEWVMDTALMDAQEMEYNPFIATVEMHINAEGIVRYVREGGELQRSQWTVVGIDAEGVVTYNGLSLRERDEDEEPAELIESWLRFDDEGRMILLASPEGPDLSVYGKKE